MKGTQDPGSHQTLLVCVVKIVTIAIAGYVAMMLANGILFIPQQFIGIMPPALLWSIWGPLANGLIIGLLSYIWFPRISYVRGVILALIPIAYSWFVRGSKTLRVTYHLESGTLVCKTALQPVYSILLLMLVVAAVSSVAIQLWLDYKVRRRSRGA